MKMAKQKKILHSYESKGTLVLKSVDPAKATFHIKNCKCREQELDFPVEALPSNGLDHDRHVVSGEISFKIVTKEK
jgi:hypothetical protein